MVDMLQVSPSNLRTPGENDALMQQLASKRRLDELETSLQALRRSKNLKSWLQKDAETVEQVLFAPVEEMLFESRKALIMKEDLSRKQKREKIHQLQVIRGK